MRASAFRSTGQAACCRPRAVQASPLSRAVRQQQRRGYASEPPNESRQMDTPNKNGNLPLLIGAASLIVGGAAYTISRGQPDVKHNDHGAQAGGEFTHGREQQGSWSGLDGRKSEMPPDTPNRSENLAVSEKMESKPPSKRTHPQV